MKVKWTWTVPNVLSLFRIVLVPVFAILYIKSEQYPSLICWAIGVLVLSGLTDMLDGLIARSCNQVSEFGKVLDPAADKLTQVTVMLCLSVRMKQLWPLFAVCFVKEALQSVGAMLLLLRKRSEVQAARWYGKIYTIVFYLTVVLYVVFPPAPTVGLFGSWNMPLWLFATLAVLVGVLLLISFYGYARVFLEIVRDKGDKTK